MLFDEARGTWHFRPQSLRNQFSISRVWTILAADQKDRGLPIWKQNWEYGEVSIFVAVLKWNWNVIQNKRDLS